jgi:hypothetical protein
MGTMSEALRSRGQRRPPHRWHRPGAAVRSSGALPATPNSCATPSMYEQQVVALPRISATYAFSVTR